MAVRNPQAPSAVVMIRPHHFCSNPETLNDNAFQLLAANTHLDLSGIAFHQASDVAAQLQENGIGVHIFEDESRDTPDSVFPNNWFSTHSGGHVAIYPMFAANRRREKRVDVIDMLKSHYRVQDVVDYSGLEEDDIYLEGTGAMVLDHVDRVAYAVQSKRCNPLVLERFCAHFNYEPMLFEAFDKNDTAVYHTNVLMCIGTEFVMIGLDMIRDQKRRGQIEQRFTESGRKVIALSQQQIGEFCGNAIELQSNNQRILALSARAFAALDPQQLSVLQESVKLLPLDVSAIESAGGSVRCMLAGIHLSAR
ncbi:MAG: hypothetical protein ACJAUL_003758 [Paraglaciecola sp.]|jgi:hypothetical protein